MKYFKLNSLYIKGLFFLGFGLLTACEGDRQILLLEKKTETTASFSSIESLLPPRIPYKRMHSKSDYLGINQFYLIEKKSEEMADLIEFCNKKRLNYLIRASNKKGKEVLKNNLAVFAGSHTNNLNLYVLSYLDHNQVRKSIFYEEEDEIAEVNVSQRLFSDKEAQDNIEVTSFSLSEIRNKINEELLDFRFKESFLSKKEEKKIFNKYQYEAHYFLENKSLRYNVVVKTAKGKTNDTNEEGYGIHVEYLPQSGVIHKSATFSVIKENPKYDKLRPSKGMKYYQELNNLITAVTFVTKLANTKSATIKDYSPVTKMKETIEKTRQSPHYSFTIGGGLHGEATHNGPILGFNSNGGYTYNSKTLSSMIAQEDVKFIIEQGTGGRKLGIQYLQDFVAGKPYFYKHPRTPLGHYKMKNNEYNDGYSLIEGGLNKKLGSFSSSIDSHFFHAEYLDLPGMSRSNSTPTAMVNYFVPINDVPESGDIKIKAKIFLDYLNVKAGQTPFDYINLNHKRSSIEGMGNWVLLKACFFINLKKLGSR